MSPRPRPFVPTMNAAEEGTLKGQLIKLGMYTIAASFEAEAERAAKDETPYAAYLARLIELEMTDKADRSVNARIARARFPVIRTLDELVAAEVSHNLGKVLAHLRRVDLLIVDELGYLPMDGRRANLFFQLVAARYTRGSLMITSNVAFDGWGKLFGDDVIASAILDRLLHHSEIFAINGPSYRL